MSFRRFLNSNIWYFMLVGRASTNSLTKLNGKFTQLDLLRVYTYYRVPEPRLWLVEQVQPSLVSIWWTQIHLEGPNLSPHRPKTSLIQRIGIPDLELQICVQDQASGNFFHDIIYDYIEFTFRDKFRSRPRAGTLGGFIRKGSMNMWRVLYQNEVLVSQYKL